MSTINIELSFVTVNPYSYKVTDFQYVFNQLFFQPEEGFWLLLVLKASSNVGFVANSIIIFNVRYYPEVSE